MRNKYNSVVRDLQRGADEQRELDRLINKHPQSAVDAQFRFLTTNPGDVIVNYDDETDVHTYDDLKQDWLEKRDEFLYETDQGEFQGWTQRYLDEDDQFIEDSESGELDRRIKQQIEDAATGVDEWEDELDGEVFN